MATLKEIFSSDNMTPELYRSNKYLNQGANYLSISDVTMVLNQLFDGNWDFEITKSWREEYPAYNKEKLYDPETKVKSVLPKEELLKEVDTYFYVQGRLTVRTLDENGNTITIFKDDIGSNCVRKAEKTGRMDYASGYKSAVSSALKGCADNLDISVLKAEDVNKIKEFVGTKKLAILKDRFGVQFKELVSEFAKKHDIEIKDAVGGKYINKLVMELEKNVDNRSR